MARHTAIAAVSETIVGILTDARQTAGISGEIALFDISRFQQATPLANGLSVYLYRTTISSVQRNRRMAPRPDGLQLASPLPLDLHYLITAWNNTSIQTQHRLLGWGMRTLADYAILSATLLNHYSPGEDDTFAEDETLELSYHPLSLEDMNTVMEPLRPGANTSAPYVVRILYLESAITLTEAPDVQTRIIELGEKDS
jgi:hypothetical protein